MNCAGRIPKVSARMSPAFHQPHRNRPMAFVSLNTAISQGEIRHREFRNSLPQVTGNHVP